MRFDTVHEDLLAAFPELTAAYTRLFEDWDNFEGDSPGQYIVFADLCGTLLEVTLTLPPDAPGREELLRRILDFGEMALTADDDEVRGLGIDAIAETLNGHPAGPDVVGRLGGNELRGWFSAYGAAGVRSVDDEIIDLWGVRAAIAPLLPATAMPDIPGISYPACSPELESLEEAQVVSDGVVMLAAYGTDRPYAVVRASQVATSEAILQETAMRLAATLGGDNPLGVPRAHFRRVPMGERVWNMDLGPKRHTRLWDEPWIADAFASLRPALLAVMAGDLKRLPVFP